MGLIQQETDIENSRCSQNNENSKFMTKTKKKDLKGTAKHNRNQGGKVIGN